LIVPRNDRHLSPENLDRVLAAEVPYLNPIAGDPPAWLFVTPSADHLGIRIHSPDIDHAPPTHLRHVISRLTHQDAGRALEVVVTIRGLFRAAYPLLCSIVDRVQLDGMRPGDALTLTLRQFAALLKREESLPREREVGLFGELLSLAGLIETIGEDTALSGWRGASREEHDFGLAEEDIEVKTTTGERRTHWVESLTQLVNTQERPLWLVSHQITQAGAGAGARLPDLIAVVRDLVGSGPRRDDLEAGIAASGWDDGMADRCTTRWTRRSPSAVYAVNDDFPRLTPGYLSSAGVALDRFAEVRYRVDLTGLTPLHSPAGPLRAVTGFQEG
jgi:hypothetical protein